MAQSIGAVALDIVMGKNTVSGVAKQAIADVQKTFNDGTATIGNKVSAVGDAAKQVGASLTPVSLAAQGVIKSTTQAAMNFETSMAQVKTIAGDASVSYKGNMRDMSDAIMQLSKDTGISAEEIAGATYNAISAGVDVSKSVEFVATANALAVGGFTDMTTSVDVLTTTLNAYGDKAGTAESISDKLITTQNLGKTTVNELASSMGKVIPTASAYGISIDNLCASYVAMTKGGIATAESTTYMKSMFNELADSGSTVGTILQEKTGKSFGQLMGEGKSLADVIDILGQSVNGDSEAFAQLWGSSEAGTGALAILNGGTADFNNTLKEMGNSTGAASDAMDKMNNTSAHDMQVAMNDLKNAGIELGASLTPIISKVADVVSKAANAFSNLSPEAQSVIGTLLMLVAVAAPLLMIIGSITSGIGGLISMGGMLTGAIGGLTGGLGGLAAAFNPVTLAIGAVVGAGAVLIANWDSIKEVAGFVGEKIGEAWGKLKEKTAEAWESVKTKTSEAWNSAKDAVSNAVTNIKNKVSETWNNIKTKTTEAFNSVKNTASNIWSGIKNTVSNLATGAKNAVSNCWNNIKSTTTEAFNSVKNFASNTWNGIKNTVSNLASGAKNAVSNAWENIKSKTSSTFNNIKSTASNIWGGIKNTVSNACSNMKSKSSEAFSNMVSTIKSKGENIKSAVSNTFTNAKTTIKNFSSQAKTWGADFANGLANGISGAASKVVNAAKGLGDKIKSYLHFSRPDVGPLRDYETWMPDFMQGMANGIENNKYKVIDAVRGMAGQMTVPAMTAPALKNVGNGGIQQASYGGDDRLYGLLSTLVTKLDNTGDITIPVYLGNDLIDERIIRANDRRTVRSGGRA